MITEIALVVASIKVIDYIKDTENREFKKKFKSVMEAIGIKNKRKETFYIKKINKTSYGYILNIKIAEGLAVKNLEDKIEVLQDNFNSIIHFKKHTFKADLIMYLVNKDISTFIFSPVKQKASQLFVGKDTKGYNYFIDLNKDPMVLVCGKTGYGKTMLLSSMLTNLIYNCKDVELWLMQLIKGELNSFDKCKQVKFSAYTEEDVIIAVTKIREKIDKRTELFKQYGIRNIEQWNKYFQKRKMKRIFLICEEMSKLIEQKELFNDLWDIAKTGRSVGVHLIGAIQRITHTNINTNVRSQMTKITFRQNGEADSKLTIGNKKSMDLKQGECIVDIGNQPKIKVPFIDEDFVVLNKYVHEIKTPSKEIKKEILNIKKDDRSIKIIDTHFTMHGKEHNRSGVVSLEEIEHADRKR